LKLKQKWETNGCKSDNRDVDGNNTGTKRDAAGAPIATGVTSTGLSVAGGAGINLDTNTSPEGGIKKTKLGSPGTPQAPTRRAAAAASASTRGRGGRTKQTARKSIIGDEPRPEPRRPRPELSSPEQTAKTERVCGPKSSDGQPLVCIRSHALLPHKNSRVSRVIRSGMPLLHPDKVSLRYV
jgi:hypothetical protein